MNNRLSAPGQQRLARRAHLLPDFLAVARAGGIRQAAEQVSITQSALTRRVQELESALGVTLFERSVQGMRLTPFGQALRHHAEMMELDCSYAAAEISELLEGQTGELRIASGPAWAHEIAPDAAGELIEHMPGVRLTMMTGMNEVTLPMLRAGELDLVLGGLPPEEDRLPELTYAALIRVRHEVFASTAHPLQQRRSVSPKALADHPWIWLRDAVSARALLAQAFQRAGIAMPPSAIETTSMDFGFRLLQRGQHLMVLPSTLERAALREGLAPLRLKAPIGSFVAGIIYRPALERLRAFRCFKEALVAQTEGMEAAQRGRLDRKTALDRRAGSA